MPLPRLACGGDSRSAYTQSADRGFLSGGASVPRKRTNPFNVVLGAVGILFTVTAMSYCVFVLRGVQAAEANAATPPAAFERLMDGYGTSILVGQLAVLAIATVGAVAFDSAEGKKEVARRQAATGAAGSRSDSATTSPADTSGKMVS